MDLDFVALLFSILHRRRLLRAVRIRVRSPSFKATIPHFCALRTLDFTDLANTLRELLGLILCSSPFFFLFYIFLLYIATRIASFQVNHHTSLLVPHHSRVFLVNTSLHVNRCCSRIIPLHNTIHHPIFNPYVSGLAPYLMPFVRQTFQLP